MRLTKELGVVKMTVHSDSMLVVYQVNGGFQVKSYRTELYMNLVRRLIKNFKKVMSRSREKVTVRLTPWSRSGI